LKGTTIRILKYNDALMFSFEGKGAKVFCNVFTVSGAKPQMNIGLIVEKLLGIRPFEDLEYNRLILFLKSAVKF